jgi:hypothetical protein
MAAIRAGRNNHMEALTGNNRKQPENSARFCLNLAEIQRFPLVSDG